MYKYGIDVSYANGKINWEKVKNQIDFAILRVAWIGNKSCEEDSTYRYNYNECKRLGIPIGAYVYSYCENTDTLRNGAEFVLGIMVNDELDLPLFLDLEDKQIAYIDKDSQTDNTIDFCDYIETNSDFKCGVYANLDWYNNHLNLKTLNDYNIPLWVAHWGVAPEKYSDSNFMMLQYDGDVDSEIDGIYGKVDLNIQYEFNYNSNKNDNYKYCNGSTIEPVYCDIYCNKQIGYLNQYEKCKCLGVINSKAIVLYNVDSDKNKKIGFVKWLGGVKHE